MLHSENTTEIENLLFVNKCRGTLDSLKNFSLTFHLDWHRFIIKSRFNLSMALKVVNDREFWNMYNQLLQWGNIVHLTIPRNSIKLTFDIMSSPCSDLTQYTRIDNEWSKEVKCAKSLFPVPTDLGYHNGISVGDKFPQFLSHIPSSCQYLFIVWLMNFNINLVSEMAKPSIKVGTPMHCQDSRFKQLIAYSNELDIHGSFEVKRVWNVYWPYHELPIESTFGCINRLRILVYLTEQGEVPITVLKSWYDNIIILDFNLLKSNSPPVTVDYVNGRKHHFQLLNFQVNDEQDLLMCFDPACPLCASSCTTLNEVVYSEITLAQHKVEEPMIPENADLPEPMISETTALPQSPVATSTLDLSSWTKSYCTASSHTAKYLGQNVQILNFTREEMRTFYVVFSFESKIAIGTLNIDNDVVETLHTEFFSAITPTPTPVLNVTLRLVVYNIDKELRRFSRSIDQDRPQCKPFDNQLTMFALHHQLLYQAILIAFEGPIFMIQYKPKMDKQKTIRRVLPLPLARDSFDSQCIDMAAAKIVLLSQRRLCC
ncbi:hypothetical protein GEMRC1_006373 [Eukaryota sp. GEM-RC1]